MSELVEQDLTKSKLKDADIRREVNLLIANAKSDLNPAHSYRYERQLNDYDYALDLRGGCSLTAKVLQTVTMLPLLLIIPISVLTMSTSWTYVWSSVGLSLGLGVITSVKLIKEENSRSRLRKWLTAKANELKKITAQQDKLPALKILNRTLPAPARNAATQAFAKLQELHKELAWNPNRTQEQDYALERLVEFFENSLHLYHGFPETQRTSTSDITIELVKQIQSIHHAAQVEIDRSIELRASDFAAQGKLVTIATSTSVLAGGYDE